MIKKRSARMALLACASVASLGLMVGASPVGAKSKGKAVTKTATVTQCANQSVSIPDDIGGPTNSVSAPLNFQVPKFRGKPQDGLVTAVNSIGVGITHTFAGDLNLFLVSPGGKAATLATSEGSGRDGFGTGSGCSGSPVLFGDSFTDPIVDVSSTGDAPISGSFKPEQALSPLAGGPARGNWTLVAFDDSSADTGTINALSVNLTYTYKALKKVKKKKK